MAGTIEPADGYVAIGSLRTDLWSTLGKPLIDPVVTDIEAHNMPIVTLIKKFRRIREPKLPVDGKFQWFERHQMPFYDHFTAAAIAAATTGMTVAHAEYFPRRVLFKNLNTDELILQESAATIATNTLGTVVRSWGDVDAQPIAANDPILIIGIAGAEGQNAPDSWTLTSELVYNYFTDSVDALDQTLYAKLARLYTNGNPWDIEMRDHLTTFARRREMDALHGQKRAGTYNQSTSGYLGGLGSYTAAKEWHGEGIFRALEDRATDERTWEVWGTLTRKSLRDKIAIWADRAKDPWLFVPRIVSVGMGEWKWTKTLMSQKETELNFVIDNLTILPGKDIKVVYDPALNGSNAGVSNVGVDIIGLDMAAGKSPEYIEFFADQVLDVPIDNNATDKKAQIKGMYSIIVRDANQHLLIRRILDVED